MAAARDQFIFSTGDGKDVITDFVATGSSHDVLNLAGHDAVKSFGDLMADHVKQVGADVLITLDGDSILLKSVTLSALDKGDFLF